MSVNGKECLKKSFNSILALLFGVVFIVGSVANRHLGKSNYTLDWITANSLYLIAALLCVIPAALNRWKFGLCVLLGTLLGLIAGELFGHNPDGAALGYGHYGWIIWLSVFAVALICGFLWEGFSCKRKKA